MQALSNEEAKAKAIKILELTSSIDAFIQKNTAEVCPLCPNVCCKNRHGRHDEEDLALLAAAEIQPPAFDNRLDDEAACQYMSETGCTLKRPVRPFRCNWYFCTTLLVHMQNGPAKPYREFMKILDEIVRLRKEVIEVMRPGSAA